jgi:enterochelin esterase-like enzyme
MITRRALLGGAGLAAAGLLGGCSAARPRFTTVTGGVSEAHQPGGVTIRAGSFHSRHLGGPAGWAIVRPPGHASDRLPVLVALHCRGGNHNSIYSSLHLDQFLAQAVDSGVPPFAIASVDGGDASYWHPRHGTGPAGMVVHEFLPRLARQHVVTSRIGLYGWSMGGYGALYLAERLGARRVSVVIAESPAIWHHSWQSAAGAFDDAADWRRHDIWPRLHRLHGMAVRIDCGASDGFAPVTRDLRARIHPTPAGGIEPAAHDGAFWHSQAPAALRFAGRHL